MKAMVTYKIENHLALNWYSATTRILKRSMHYLLKDIIPTVIILILVSWGAQLVTEKIHQAKMIRATVMADAPVEKSLP